MGHYLLTSGLRARVRGKTIRTFLRAPLVKPWSEHRYHARLGRHAENLPWVSRDRFDVITDLRAHGVAIRDAMTIPAAALEVADRFVVGLRECATPDIVLPHDVAAHPALYKWGLTDDNLDLAEHYIGLPVHYLGVGVRRERADGVVDDVRQWHRDIEDRRMLKIIVYLSDVSDGGGPFEYIDRPASNHAARILKYSSGFVSDATMARTVPPADWIQAIGPRLSAIFVDTSRVFHRAQAPTKTDRYSMTFSYSSRTPFQTFPDTMLSPADLARLCNELTPRQCRAAMA